MVAPGGGWAVRARIFGDGPVNETTTWERERDRHLFGPGPKRLLALDGGGVRGAITVAFLERIEDILSQRLGRQVHLGDWFDLVGGTSTGAIIAGALALGYTTADIKRFYLELAPRVFKRPFWRIMGLQAKFDARALRQEIESIVGDCTLDSEKLITGLCVVTKRMDTGSPWILANNRGAPYWEGSPRGASSKGHTGNKDYKLSNLVRASTAAPFFFDPEWLPIAEGEPPGLFVDGGVTPHNNPSLILFLMTVLTPFKLCWQPGPENLSIVSIGTGTHRDRLVPDELGMGRTTKLAIHALTSLMTDIQTFILMQMQYLGQCPAPWPINSEIGTLANESPPHGKMFRFLRYDLKLELPWIEQNLGKRAEDALERKLTETDVVRMRSMDDPTIIPDIYKLAKLAAEIQVKPEHWLGDLPGWCASVDLSTRPRLPEPAPDQPLPATDTFSVAVSHLRAWLARMRNPAGH
ncbi:MAG: hypothetical protein QOC56_218 [Alphaproteobacteria bacterium]|nr:hypothetical protein [Alphaproteobacteria bacterium]